MPTRIALPVLLTLLAQFMPAQTPPPDIDAVLRARVTEFLQYHVDANFRKAYDMVAEDTKDNYFTSGKVQIKSFKIDDVKYSDNFTKAVVKTTMGRTMNVGGTDIPVLMPSTITWKIENGKWVWYNEPKAVSDDPLMGPSLPRPAVDVKPDPADEPLPKKLDTSTIAAAARDILQQVTIDKKEITLAGDKPSVGRVVLHNGMSGSVQLDVTTAGIAGFTTQLEPRLVRAGSDAVLVLRYEPGGATPPKDAVELALTVQPTNQAFVIHVIFRNSK